MNAEKPWKVLETVFSHLNDQISLLIANHALEFCYSFD